MQGEGNPSDPDIVLFFQPVNTPGDEVAPGSDVIRENLQNHFLVLVHDYDTLASDLPDSAATWPPQLKKELGDNSPRV